MTPSGWIVMTLSVGFVTSLMSWCIYRVLSQPGVEEHMHAAPEIDTRDNDD